MSEQQITKTKNMKSYKASNQKVENVNDETNAIHVATVIKI